MLKYDSTHGRFNGDIKVEGNNLSINGKLRDTITLPKGVAKDVAEAAALASDKVVRALDGKSPRKIIVVPDRLVNIVA